MLKPHSDYASVQLSSDIVAAEVRGRRYPLEKSSASPEHPSSQMLFSYTSRAGEWSGQLTRSGGSCSACDGRTRASPNRADALKPMMLAFEMAGGIVLAVLALGLVADWIYGSSNSVDVSDDRSDLRP